HSKKTKKTKPVASESSLTFKSLEGSENPFLDVYRSTQKDMPADIDRMMGMRPNSPVCNVIEGDDEWVY
ncbi:hypothetical protein SARC_14364, partial [Sphaeroforma arctica JP610]